MSSNTKVQQIERDLDEAKNELSNAIDKQMANREKAEDLVERSGMLASFTFFPCI